MRIRKTTVTALNKKSRIIEHIFAYYLNSKIIVIVMLKFARYKNLILQNKKTKKKQNYILFNILIYQIIWFCNFFKKIKSNIPIKVYNKIENFYLFFFCLTKFSLASNKISSIFSSRKVCLSKIFLFSITILGFLKFKL